MKKQGFLLVAVICCLLVVLSGCGKDDSTDPKPADGWVDLGLPSGLLWATCNLGANSPEEYGDYYAWGETSTKSVYRWSTYNHCNGTDYDQLTKYCTRYGADGYTDTLTTLQAIDDAATQALGGSARIPTSEEWHELKNNTTTEWVTLNGVYGRRFTASNGATLFLPAAGYYSEDQVFKAGSQGFYWSSSLTEDFPTDSWYFYFYSDFWAVKFTARIYGHSIRPVRSALDTSSTLKQ